MAEPSRAHFRFYAELNDHLPPDKRQETLERTFHAPSSVKDMIESFGVPHAEVDLIAANGESVDFAYLVRNHDRIAVYPVFESIDITPELRVRPAPLRDPSFVLDVHLGKLAAYLRMLGFDTLYRSCASDKEIADVCAASHRILLTRDRGLLKRAAVTRGYWVRETDSRLQAASIVQRFDLARRIRPFTRCMACNGVLTPAPLEQIRDRVPPRAAELHEEFRECPQCGRAYWKGSHYDRMQRWIAALLERCAVPSR